MNPCQIDTARYCTAAPQAHQCSLATNSRPTVAGQWLSNKG
jgi:hypothetical protein